MSSSLIPLDLCMLYLMSIPRSLYYLYRYGHYTGRDVHECRQTFNDICASSVIPKMNQIEKIIGHRVWIWDRQRICIDSNNRVHFRQLVRVSLPYGVGYGVHKGGVVRMGGARRSTCRVRWRWFGMSRPRYAGRPSTSNTGQPPLEIGDRGADNSVDHTISTRSASLVCTLFFSTEIFAFPFSPGSSNLHIFIFY